MASVLSDPHSLGERMMTPSVVGPNSAAYKRFTDRLADEVRSMAASEGRRRQEASVVVVPFHVSPAVEQWAVDAYPEFNPVWTASRVALDPAFEVERLFSMEWALNRMQRYASDVVVLGDVLYNVAMSGRAGVHIELDPANPVAVHAACQAAQDYTQANAQALKFEERFSYRPSKTAWTDYRRGLAYMQCDKGGACRHQASAYVADVSMHRLSPLQFCAGMAQAGARVGMAVVPYHPTMFESAEGNMSGVNVAYELTDDSVIFKYPAGQSGISELPAQAWHEWLAAKRVYHRGKEYVFELVANRLNRLFAMVTEIAPSSALAPLEETHALELPWAKGKVVVTYWVLKSSYVDPMRKSSWRMVRDVFDERIVNSLRVSGLAMPKETFTWDTLMQKVRVVDSRVTIAGTTVKVDMPLSPERAQGLLIAVGSEVYAKRYEMGTLTAELMAQLKEIDKFAQATHGGRCAMLAYSLATKTWDSATGSLLGGFRGWLTKLSDYFTDSQATPMPTFVPAPSFVQFDEYASTTARYLRKAVSNLTTARTMNVHVRGAKAVSSRTGEAVAPVLLNPTRAECEVAPYAVGKELDGVALSKAATMKVSEDTVDTAATGEITQTIREVSNLMEMAHESYSGTPRKYVVNQTVAIPAVEQTWPQPSLVAVPDYVQGMSLNHEKIFPGMAQQDFSQDAVSMNIHGQERTLRADYLHHPVTLKTKPGATSVFKSRIMSYRVERRQQTMSQLLTAVEARNLAAPQISEAINIDTAVQDVWLNLKKHAFKDDADDMLQTYQQDVVGFETALFENWAVQAKPMVLERLRTQMEKLGETADKMDVGTYQVMLKADAKPPMSDKPLREQLAPQVIVHHDKLLSAFYSSIFRVLVRRFLSLLKPCWMVNLLKDTDAVRDHIAANTPWSDLDKLMYLENDFSKFDKSQDEFCFTLEHFVFEQLGMMQHLLDRWFVGHKHCRLKNLALGLTLHLMWQRKSGDATTSFGNAIVNLSALCYAYRGTQIEWGVIQGDDSLVASRGVCADNRSIGTLSEVFNLQGKYIVSDDPYYASAFYTFNADTKQVYYHPDPVKFAQKMGVSMPGGVFDEEWHARWESRMKANMSYTRPTTWPGLERALRRRYVVPDDFDFAWFMQSCGTSLLDVERYRGCWEETISFV